MFTHQERECLVIAAVLNNDAKPGPCVATALSFAPYWKSVEAGKLAQASIRVRARGLKPSVSMVKAVTEPEYKEWLNHPLFTEHGAVSMEIAEVEARSLLPYYRNLQLVELVG